MSSFTGNCKLKAHTHIRSLHSYMTTINNYDCSQELERIWIKGMLVTSDEICNGTTMETSLTVHQKLKNNKKASYHVAH